MWRDRLINMLRTEFKKGKLKMPPQLKHLRTYKQFCSWTSQFYSTDWVVEFSKQSDNMKINVDYLGKYLKRPPIGETTIKSDDGKQVTYQDLDHYTGKKELMVLPVHEFIARLVTHIPDEHFRKIRDYGFLANRVRGKRLPKVYGFLKMKKIKTKKVYMSWRQMLLNIFKYDPIKCPICGTIMEWVDIEFPISTPITSMHQQIANGYYPLL